MRNKFINYIWNDDRLFIHSIVFYTTRLWKKNVCFSTRQFKGFRLPSSSLALILFLFIIFPTNASAVLSQEQSPDPSVVALTIKKMQNDALPYGRLPSAQDSMPRRTFTIPLTAYTSDVAETDDTPCITANGFDECAHNTEDVVAANFLPFGARVRIPSLYGGRIFRVEDRMNERYAHRMDIWMKQKSDAIQFGVKHAKIEVF